MKYAIVLLSVIIPNIWAAPKGWNLLDSLPKLPKIGQIPVVNDILPDLGIQVDPYPLPFEPVVSSDVQVNGAKVPSPNKLVGDIVKNLNLEINLPSGLPKTGVSLVDNIGQSVPKLVTSGRVDTLLQNPLGHLLGEKGDLIDLNGILVGKNGLLGDRGLLNGTLFGGHCDNENNNETTMRPYPNGTKLVDDDQNNQTQLVRSNDGKKVAGPLEGLDSAFKLLFNLPVVGPLLKSLLGGLGVGGKEGTDGKNRTSVSNEEESPQNRPGSKFANMQCTSSLQRHINDLMKDIAYITTSPDQRPQRECEDKSYANMAAPDIDEEMQQQDDKNNNALRLFSVSLKRLVDETFKYLGVIDKIRDSVTSEIDFRMCKAFNFLMGVQNTIAPFVEGICQGVRTHIGDTDDSLVTSLNGMSKFIEVLANSIRAAFSAFVEESKTVAGHVRQQGVTTSEGKGDLLGGLLSTGLLKQVLCLVQRLVATVSDLLGNVLKQPNVVVEEVTTRSKVPTKRKAAGKKPQPLLEEPVHGEKAIIKEDMS